MKFTAMIEKGENGWFLGQVEEIPAALLQGKTIQEVKDNLLDALKLIFEVNKELILDIMKLSNQKFYMSKYFNISSIIVAFIILST